MDQGLSVSRQKDPTVVRVRPKFVIQYKRAFDQFEDYPFAWISWLNPSWSPEKCFFRRVTARQAKVSVAKYKPRPRFTSCKSRHCLCFSDIDECRITPRKCTGDHEICVNSYGSYSCRCRAQFRRNRQTQKCERKFLTKNLLKAIIDHFFSLAVEIFMTQCIFL